MPTAVATDSFNDTVSLHVVTLRGTVNTFRGFALQSVSRTNESPLGNFIPGANQQFLACPTPGVSTNLCNFDIDYKAIYSRPPQAHHIHRQVMALCKLRLCMSLPNAIRRCTNAWVAAGVLLKMGCFQRKCYHGTNICSNCYEITMFWVSHLFSRDSYTLSGTAWFMQGLIDPRSGERACNSAYACRDGKMLVVTKNRTKRVGG